MEGIILNEGSGGWHLNIEFTIGTEKMQITKVYLKCQNIKCAWLLRKKDFV